LHVWAICNASKSKLNLFIFNKNQSLIYLYFFRINSWKTWLRKTWV
jgi:hypothetical protein